MNGMEEYKGQKRGTKSSMEKKIIHERQKCETRQVQNSGMEKIKIIKRAVLDCNKNSYDGQE